jgi:hypothetical protein
MISACDLPAASLLGRYRGDGGYADCYVTELPWTVSQAEYVEAFYSTPLFKVERLLIRLFLSRRSTDAEAGRLARGELDTFAAWSVEGRTADQLLLADLGGRTRSWLMAEPSGSAGPAATRLHFGSAVVPARRARPGRQPGLGPLFAALLGFHKLYSRLLLRAARARLSREHGSGPVTRPRL